MYCEFSDVPLPGPRHLKHVRGRIDLWAQECPWWGGSGIGLSHLRSQGLTRDWSVGHLLLCRGTARIFDLVLAVKTSAWLDLWVLASTGVEPFTLVAELPRKSGCSRCLWTFWFLDSFLPGDSRWSPQVQQAVEVRVSLLVEARTILRCWCRRLTHPKTICRHISKR